ncbi:DUF5801 repeats-in-toxin domain-containing protein [Sulfitobacter pontiacus]
MGPVAGNVITGAGTDTLGADGATVTLVSFGGTDVAVPATGSTTIMGMYGTLTLSADGSFSYLRDARTPGGVDDTFTYTLTDGDGDTDTAVLTVSLGDSAVSIAGLDDDSVAGSDAVVNESKLANGTGVGGNSDSVSDSFTVTAFDTVQDLTVTAGGNSIAIVAAGVAADLSTPLVLTSALGSTLEITEYDAATGVVSYTYTLAAGETHSAVGRDALLDAFTIDLADTDGDTASDTLNVRILDDVPVVALASSTAALTASDADFGTDPSADFSSFFAVDHGADGADGTSGTVYTLEVSSAGVDSGLVDTASGDPILLFLEAGTIVGRVGSQTGAAAFNVDVDSATGEVTLDQLLAIEHPSAGVDAVSIATAAALLRVTALDADGDSATEITPIGDRLSFADDVPTTALTPDAGFVLPDLSTQDGDTLNGADTASADFSGAITLTNDLGNDGPAATNSEVLTYGLALQGGATSVASGLNSAGQPVTLHLIGGQIVGSTEAAAGDVLPANTVFTLDATAAGQVTLTQNQPIDHTNTASSTEPASLAADLVALTAASSVTDADGDTDAATASVNIGDSFIFTDDGPVVGATAGSTLSEDGLRVSGATLVATRDLNVVIGADRAGGVMGVSFDATQTALDALGLSSDGVALTYAVTDGLITASAGSVEVFTVALTQPTAGNGYQASYTYTQSGVIDHGDAATPLATLDLGFALTVTDSDGDTAATSFEVTVTDDTPTAVDQTAISVVEGAAAISSANGGVNLLANDTQGADGALVHQVQYVDDAGVTQTVETSGGTTGALDTQYGTLTVNADGTWSFTPDASLTHTNGAPLDATFSYTLQDTDGDISPFASQPIIVTDTTPTAVDDAAIVLTEGGTTGSGNVVTNDTASQDGSPMINSFTYTNAAGAETTFTFSGATPSTTVATPTGSLSVNADGSWTFTQAASIDHDDVDPTAGTFTYVLRDADSSLSNDATQVITVTDTNPVSSSASISLSEADLPTGSTTGSGNPTTTQSLAIVKGQDDIADVVFATSNVAGLPALTSNGVGLVYALSNGGHTLTATAGASGPSVFTLVINNPTDATGATQTMTATLLAPLDQPGATLSLLNVAYEVQDIDSSILSSAVVAIIDDTPLAPVDDAGITVEEGGTSAGSATSGANLLANDVLGADGTTPRGLVYDITYTDRSGASQTAVVTVAGTTIETQYGTLTVEQDGDWSYVPVDSADHVQPGNDLELSDDFSYRTIDGDGDISGASATQSITVTDTVPAIATPDDATVDEAALANGSNPDAAALTVTGSLDLAPEQDSFDTTITSLPTGLTANGVALEYVTQPDGHGVIAYQGTGRTIADQVFTLDLTTPTAAGAGYSFTLIKALDQGNAASIDLDFGITLVDSDGDSDLDSFTVTVLDDRPPLTLALSLDEDDTASINTSADATTANTVIWQGGVALTGAPNGTGGVDFTTDDGIVTVLSDGSILFTPDANYSGTELFEIVTNDGGVETRTDVTATVAPLSDTPTMTVDVANINTLEDTAIALGLNAPVIADTGTPVTERIGLITLTGLPSGAQLGGFTVGTTPVTIEINDIPTLASVSTPDLVLTTAQYELLTVTPPLHTSDEFTVTATVSSFEVDGAGNQISGVAGAQQTASVIVDVQAVTDDAELVYNLATAGTVDDVDAVTYVGTTEATVTIEEDTRFDLRDLLTASFADLDGSESRSITVTNNSTDAILVRGTTVGAGDDFTIYDNSGPSGQTGAIDSFRPIWISGTQDFAGSLQDITVTINAQDVDADGFIGGANGADGIAEANLANNTVTLNLEITPVAGEVEVEDVTGEEDTAIAFLENVAVTDTTAGTGGTELMTAIRFTIPSGWTVTQPVVGVGTIFTYVDVAGDATITFQSGTQAEREGVLDDFTITPPAHSSLDADIVLSIDTTDTAASGVDTATTSHTLTVEVTPVAEEIGAVPGVGDSDGDGLADLSMNGDYVYTASQRGSEDTWFALNQAGFDLSAGWANQDADEIGVANDNTYARLEPVVTVGDTSDANGAQFRWTDSGGAVQTATYAGTPIDIPASALATVEFLPAPDFSGQMQINVTAYTEDFDDDTEGTGTPDTAESGLAVLSNLVIVPVADDVALTLTARVSGLEDTLVPLQIRPRSSDDTETFNITINDIPDGALVYYDGNPTPLVVTGGSVTITDFDRTADLNILPPPDSNDDFTLSIEAVSVDTVTIDGTTFTDVSTPPTVLPLVVQVRGVADDANISVTPQTYVESALDAGATIALNTLVSASLQDTDSGDPGGPSETLTIRVSGLPDGFSLSEGALLTPPSVTGTDRVWALDTDQFALAEVNVPDNVSGLVEFNVAAVTTENDGDSQTGPTMLASFTVTPSPEATTTTSAVLVEDEVTSLNFAIVHENGDTDETITGARVRVADAVTGDYTLYLGTNPGAVLLADAGLTVFNDGTDDFYELSAAQAAELSALAAPQVDGDLGTVEIFYEITDQEFATDQEFGTGTNSTPVASAYQSVDFDLSATAVTDQPDVSITAITSVAASTVITDTIVGDDASPDNVVLNEVDTVTVTLNVASDDVDTSEQVIRILITDVPIGVTVEDAQIVGTTSWLLVYDGANAIDINNPSTDIPVTFIVSDQIGAGVDPSVINMSVQVQDRGDTAAPGTAVLSDDVSWTLNRDFPGAGGGELPAQIIDWSYSGAGATEDAPFLLSTVLNGTVNATSAAQNTLTVQLTDLPAGTVVSGMTSTVIDGVPTWTASTSSNGAGAQAALDALLASIEVTLPENANDNNDVFSMNAILTTSVVGGSQVESETISPAIPVTPVTDPADIAITFGNGDGLVDESDASIPITIDVTNAADGAAGSIIDGNLYVQIDVSNPTPTGGTLTDDTGTTTYTLQSVSGIAGIPDGDYYVILGVDYGTPVDLLFEPTTTGVGDITVDAYVENIEAGDPNSIVSSTSETQSIDVSNNGVTATTAPSAGLEVADNAPTSVIELLGLSATLNDNDGSEELVSILLSNVPVGFLVVSGADAGSAIAAEVSSNAGGSGGLNTWVLAGEGEELPAYVAIQPPQHWSGTLSGLELLVTSSETIWDINRTDTFALDPLTVAPVADGINIVQTSTFGDENEVVEFNFNASIVDAIDASILPVAPDQHQETATIEITGLGEHASFYVGSTERTEGISYNAGADTYTLTGLTQAMIDALGYKQAATALQDQDAGQAGLQLAVSAFTVEASDPATTTAVSAASDSTITLNIFAQQATTGDDTLLWTGTPIDALAGEDTIVIRSGEDLTGAELETNLSNVETLDLGVAGANEIDNLTPEQVQAMTDGGNMLNISGTADDNVNLSSAWQQVGATTTYETTVGSGPSAETITVIIDSAIQVSIAPSFMSMAAPATFGLAMFSAPADGPEEGKDEAAPEGLTFEDVMSGEPEEDLGALLPASSGGADPSTSSGEPETGEGIFTETTWDEDPMDGLVFDS